MEMLRAELEETMGKFVADHAEFVKNWAIKNLPQGSGAIGVSTLAAGLGASVGVFCTEMEKQVKANPSILRSIVVTQLDKNIKQKEDKYGHG